MRMHTALQTSTPLLPNKGLKAVDPLDLTLHETIEYALEGTGGGFRLKLARATSEASGIDIRSSEHLAKGIELFHHASLIFDDLPCMDYAKERRGRRCLHLVTSESNAILAALALVNRAYTLLWKISSQYPKFSKSAARVVERFIGELGILGGSTEIYRFVLFWEQRKSRRSLRVKRALCFNSHFCFQRFSPEYLLMNACDSLAWHVRGDLPIRF